MKKVTNISIGERVFSIEEDGFEVLQKYLKSIGDYFKKQESDEEILQDIEYSISEKLDTKKRNLKNAITLSDVEIIIKELGTLEELTDGDVNTPEITEEKSKKIKQLYRDGENKVIAGVSSGIANYFGISDPIIVRIAFIILVFISGFGILLYLILWVIVPVARTASQKLAMRGEAANLENITDFFDEKLKKKVDNNIFIKILLFPFVVIGFILNFIPKFFLIIIPILRIIIGIIILFISSILLLLIGFFGMTLFLGFPNEFGSDIALLISRIDNFNVLFLAILFSLVIPLFILFIQGIYLTSKKNVFGVKGYISIFFIWLLLFLYSTAGIILNIPTIKNTIQPYTVNRDVYNYSCENGGDLEIVKIHKGDQSLHSGRWFMLKPHFAPLGSRSDSWYLIKFKKDNNGKTLLDKKYNKKILLSIYNSKAGLYGKKVELKDREKAYSDCTLESFIHLEKESSFKDLELKYN